MPSLAQGTGYAALAMGFIASAAGKPLLVRSIAEGCDLPAPYLAKIINRLARAGLVLTQRGIHGGTLLARDASAITLFDVCEALDDPIIERRCMLGVSTCSDDRACPAHDFSIEQRRRNLAFLTDTTIADVAAFESKRRWKGWSAESTRANGVADVQANGRTNGHTRANADRGERAKGFNIPL